MRSGWFDRVESGDDRIVFEQGDTGEGGVSRAQLAEVLVQGLIAAAALSKPFELSAVPGAARTDWAAMFTALVPDGTLDGPFINNAMPLDDEPEAIRCDLERWDPGAEGAVVG